jgi:hypothetical protein
MIPNVTTIETVSSRPSDRSGRPRRSGNLRPCPAPPRRSSTSTGR